MPNYFYDLPKDLQDYINNYAITKTIFDLTLCELTSSVKYNINHTESEIHRENPKRTVTYTIFSLSDFNYYTDFLEVKSWRGPFSLYPIFAMIIILNNHYSLQNKLIDIVTI